MNDPIKPFDPRVSAPGNPPNLGTEGRITGPHEPEHIMQFFAYGHLPPSLQAVSLPFANLATIIVNSVPRNPERTVALRKLLESKDAAVRAFIAK